MQSRQSKGYLKCRIKKDLLIETLSKEAEMKKVKNSSNLYIEELPCILSSSLVSAWGKLVLFIRHKLHYNNSLTALGMSKFSLTCKGEFFNNNVKSG